jgi:hypothetical protein
MTCCWLFLASRISEEHFCGEPGDPYCPEHTRLWDYIVSLDENFEDVEATHKVVCEEPMEEEQQFCAVCICGLVHDGCVYCDDCCADDPLGVLGPQG